MFNKIRMQSEFNTAMLFDGVFYNGANTAACPDGACVLIQDPLTHDVYDGTTYGGVTPPSYKDLNANKIIAYATETEGIIGFVDFVGVNGTTVQGNYWKIGDKVAGMEVPAGEHTRVRIPQIGDEFYLAKGNFTAATAPEIGKYAAPTAGTELAVANTKAASGLCVKIIDEKTLIQGSVNDTDKLYRVRVIQK